MSIRRAAIGCAALVAALLPMAAATNADALQAPVAFTSANLSTYQTNGIAWAVAAAQGKVFVGGTFTSVRPAGAAAGTSETPRTNFVVLDAATGAPTTCAPAFTVTSNPAAATVRALDVSPDGATLYVGGYFTSAGGAARQFLAALDIAACTINTTFKPFPNATVRAIRSTATTVYYGGDIVTVNGAARTYAAAAVAVGKPGAGSLSPWAPKLDKNVRALGIKPDGTAVVIGGNFDTVNSVTSNRLVVVDSATGTTNVATFTGLNTVGSAVKSIAVDASGFYTGNEGTGTGSFDGRLAFNWSGYTQRWKDSCLGATQSVILYQGVLYSGSHAHDCSLMGWFPDGARNHFLAETTTGSAPSILSWFPNTNDGLGEMIGPRALTIATSGTATYLYAVGEFTTVNGVAQQGITRFGTGPDAVAPSTPVISVQSPTAGQVRIAWRTSLDTDDASLTYRIYRDTSTTPIYTVTASSWFWNRQQQVFTDSGLANGSTHSYKVSASDGINVRTSAAASVTVASSASAYATRVLADGPSLYLRYNEGSSTFFSDATANRNNLTLVGAGTFRTAGAITGSSTSFTFTGTSSRLYGETRVPAPATYSIETWFKGTAGGVLVELGNKQTYPSTTYDRILYLGASGKLVFGVHPGAYVTLSSPGTYTNGSWHHAVATQGASGMALYVDGALVASTTTTTAQSFAGYWHVGGDVISTSWPDKPVSSYFVGSVDETAIYPTALPQSTVAAHYALR
jgi:hypothetical protein